VRALQIDRTGSLNALAIRTVADPRRKNDEAIVRVEAAGVNPSDIGIVLGRFGHLTLPRVLGRDFTGEVIDGPAELIGKLVWGTGGGELGLTRDGTHAELLAIPANTLALRPPQLSSEGAAAIGTPALTAWITLVDLAHTKAGEWVIVSGAAGSVGMLAVQLVKALGAKPIALVRSSDDVTALEEIGVSSIVRSDRDDLAAVTQRLTDGKGAGVALNAVGAPIYAALVDALGKGGRLVIFSAAGGREVTLDLFGFYRKRLTFYGLDSAALSMQETGAILKRVSPYIESGALVPPPIAEIYPLEQAAEAYGRVQAGAGGKVVIRPND
jgi:NADPH:quinone reductase